MTAALAEPPVDAPSPTIPLPRTRTLRDIVVELGDIPLDRVLFDPPPQTATEADHVRMEAAGRLFELVDNTLVEKTMGFWEEQIGSEILILVGSFVREHKLGLVNGPAAFMWTETNDLRAPDVTFTSTARIPQSREPRPKLSPDLIVEVLSPGNTTEEIQRKIASFFAGGTRVAWVVDPKRRIVAVHRPNAETVERGMSDTLEGGDELPGFSLVLADLFGDIDG